MVSELKWAEGTKPKPIQHYSFPFELDLENLWARSTFQAVAVNMAEEAIVNTAISEAKAEGISELYLMDRQFVLDALKEKIEREKKKEE